MRIVAGQWAGVSLVSPGNRVRPTKEEIRDAWISDLEREIPRAKILDLFSGTGALGLEALSRGASSVDFVENGPHALHALKANITKLRVKKWTRLFKKDAFVFLAGLDRGTRTGSEKEPKSPAEASGVHYDLALADPPYTSKAVDRLVGLWLERPFSLILSVEHAADRTLPKGGRRRRFGDTAVTTYRIREKKTGAQRSGHASSDA
jgi:16S rRNA (guanine966-N2)-methyltransferase